MEEQDEFVSKLTEQDKQEILKQCFDLPMDKKDINKMHELYRKSSDLDVVEYNNELYTVEHLLLTSIEDTEDYQAAMREAEDEIWND